MQERKHKGKCYDIKAKKMIVSAAGALISNLSRGTILTGKRYLEYYQVRSYVCYPACHAPRCVHTDKGFRSDKDRDVGISAIRIEYCFNSKIRR